MSLKNGRRNRATKREFSAGGAVFRVKVPEVSKVSKVSKAWEAEWLLIRQKGSKNWRLPKGNIERGEGSSDAAVREVWEETGVRAKVIEKLDSIRYFYVLKGVRIFKTVAFFLMECLEGNPRIDRRWAHEIEEARWVGTKKAIGCLAFPSEKRILKKAAGRVGRAV